MFNLRPFQKVWASSAAMSSKILSLEHINPHVKNVEYAVRGPIVQKATNYQLQIDEGKGSDLPFNTVIKANIGDCQAMGQKPITYIRQVLSACQYPPLLEANMFPPDVVRKANKILDGCGGRSIGSYSESVGNRVFRKDIANYISQRDNHPSDLDTIIMSNGASEIIKLTLFVATFGSGVERTGIMIPVPQYPLYSASIAEVGSQQISYYLNEEAGWSLDMAELERSYQEAKKICTPRAIVVINPGNPTGQVLTRQNIDDVIKFAHDKKMFLMADEVYQDNVYAKGAQFYSFKKCLAESPYKDALELVSFHSMSKGYMGECGIRGGYGEYVNFDPAVLAQIKKLKSAQLCSAVIGQAAMSIVTDPPKPGDPSYDQFIQEKNAVLSSLKTRAQLVYDKFSKMKGITVNPVCGAMYCFPRIDLPQKAIEQAQKEGKIADAFYVEKLLDATGICLVPGSGFGQKPGTYHFRTTILPPEDQVVSLLDKFEAFHLSFLAQYT